MQVISSRQIQSSPQLLAQHLGVGFPGDLDVNDTCKVINNNSEGINNTGKDTNNTGEDVDDTGEDVDDTGGDVDDTSEDVDDTCEAVDDTGEDVGGTGGGDPPELSDFACRLIAVAPTAPPIIAPITRIIITKVMKNVFF